MRHQNSKAEARSHNPPYDNNNHSARHLADHAPAPPRALHRRVPSLSNYAATSITKHYQVNQQVLAAFEAQYEAKLYHVAYAIGLQFVETALLEIPKHGYFYSPRHDRERMQSSLEAVRVTSLLQQIQTALGHVYTEDLERIQRLHELALQQVQQASEDQYETQRAHTVQELRASSSHLADWVVLDPLLECHESLSSLFCPSTHSKSVVPSPETIIPATPAHSLPPIVPDLLDRGVPLKESSSVPSHGDDNFTEPRDEASHVRQADLLHFDSSGVDSTKYDSASSSSTTKPSFSSSPPRPESNRQASWGQPPPLLAQENSAIYSSDQIQHRSLALRRPTTSLGAEIAQLPPRPPPPSTSSSSDEEEDAEEWMVVSQPPPYDRQGSLSSGLVTQKPHRPLDTTEDDIFLERALFLSGLELVDAPPSADAKGVDMITRPPAIRVSSASRLEFGTLSTLYHDDFDHLVQTRRIRVTTIATYQGRVHESTNGCTVIAPLLCMHHLLNDDADSPVDTGLPDAEIVQVIDNETPAILGDLRRRLGLADQAFLIPSDVHDYLIENGQLHQSQFIDVMGGNMLQDKHLNNFVSSLANAAIPKLAATLFFHEHVVCILKLERGNGMFWYDLIDSLPLPDTLHFSEESQDAFYRRFGLQSDDPRLKQVLLPFSVRFRCIDAEALQACLRWYACSKFTEENIRYIDQYEWEDAQTDFDPRVFQAFLWGSPRA